MTDLLTRLQRLLRRPPRPAGLSCRELVTLVSDYLDGELSAGETLRFEAHIAGCDGCTAYVEQMRTTRTLLGRLEPADLPLGAEDELRAAFRDWRSGGR